MPAWATGAAPARSRQAGGPKDRARSGTGGRSGGESHGELDRRKIRDRITELQKSSMGWPSSAETQRARRRERQELARVRAGRIHECGQSTLMRALTRKRGAVATSSSRR